MARLKAAFNWSGGKDSAMALHKVLEEGEVDVVALITTINEAHSRVSMHGLRETLLDAQAAAIGIPLYKIYVPENQDMAGYSASMEYHWKILKELGVTQAIFGDIFLEDLRSYREESLSALGITCLFPIWKQDTTELLTRFSLSGFKAILCCVKSDLQMLLGKPVGPALIELMPIGTDPCGENGEYHSFVYAAPFFKCDVGFSTGDAVLREFNVTRADTLVEVQGYWYLDLLPA